MFTIFRNHGRYMTKGGYVDSSRRIHSLYRQQEGTQLSKHDASSTGNLLLPSLGKSAPAAHTTTEPRKSKGFELSNSLSTSTNLKNQAKEFEKQMRLIKVCLMIHKCKNISFY